MTWRLAVAGNYGYWRCRSESIMEVVACFCITPQELESKNAFYVRCGGHGALWVGYTLSNGMYARWFTVSPDWLDAGIIPRGAIR